MQRKMLLLFIFAVLLWPCAFSSPVQCKDEAGKPVDWFVAVKLPRLKKSSISNVRNGVAYVYITSDNEANNWTLSNLTVEDSNSIMGSTLNPLYSDQASTVARLLYNDEPPHDNTTMTLGHTKGVVVGDSVSGFWLVHSVPHYPPESGNNAYAYPKTGTVYGQSFLCITMLPKDLQIIGQQLIYNEPFLYDTAIPENLMATLPSFVEVAKGSHRHQAPWFNAAEFSSKGGVTFNSFAKSKHFGKDLYADWVAPYLETNLLVETWNHGGAKIQSECDKPFKVENIEGVTLGQFSYSTSEDHSKWAVSTGIEKPWVCIGDINRMEHQKQRGGGTVCFKNDHLFYAYHDSVKNLDVCPTRITPSTQP